jgi:hypothetical protein
MTKEVDLADYYDHWGLYKASNIIKYNFLFEGPKEECFTYATDHFTEDQQQYLFLIDCDGREWDL